MANEIKPIMVRVPPEIAEAIKTDSKTRGESVNWIITCLLAEAYGVDVKNVVKRAPKKPRTRKGQRQCETGLVTTEHLQQPP